MPQKPSCMHYASGVHDVRADASHHNGTVEGKTAVTALISAKSLSDCQPPLILALPGTLRGMQPMTACAALMCQINVVISPSCGCHHISSCTCHSHIKLQHQILRCAKCWDPSKIFLTLKVALFHNEKHQAPTTAAHQAQISWRCWVAWSIMHAVQPSSSGHPVVPAASPCILTQLLQMFVVPPPSAL